MASPEGQGYGIKGRRPLSLTALLGTVTFLLTAFLFVVSDALARGGSGSHSFHSSGGGSGGGGSSGSSHHHFTNSDVSGGGSSGGSAGVIIVIVVVVVIIAITLFFVWRARRARTGGA